MLFVEEVSIWRKQQGGVCGVAIGADITCSVSELDEQREVSDIHSGCTSALEHAQRVCLRIIRASQVKMVHDAAALVCVHGADCMNLMFLPPQGVVVEIDPVHYGALRPLPAAAALDDALEASARSCRLPRQARLIILDHVAAVTEEQLWQLSAPCFRKSPPKSPPSCRVRAAQDPAQGRLLQPGAADRQDAHGVRDAVQLDHTAQCGRRPGRLEPRELRRRGRD